MENTPTLLVMAAGLGSRYGGLKQIAGVGPQDETIVDYSVFDAMRTGFDKVVFIIRRSIEDQFIETYGRWEKEIHVEYVFQELDMLPSGHTVPDGREKPWGTGHAVLQAAGSIDGPFAVINADDFYGTHAFQVVCDHLVETMSTPHPDYCMVAYELGRTLSPTGPVTRGICSVDSEGFLVDVTETAGVAREGGGVRRPDGAGSFVALGADAPTSMNMWGFTPTLFEHLSAGFSDFLSGEGFGDKEFLLPAVITDLIHSGRERVRVLHSPDPCIGVTHREDHQQMSDRIAALIEAGRYPRALPV